MTDLLDIREQGPGDSAGIRVVNEAAFGRTAEADLVDALRERGRVVLSLVAVRAGHVVGHLLLSKARINSGSTATDCLALGPMAVIPDLWRQGIGSRLVERAVDLARERGHGIVVVLGHPDYYPRFGFERASSQEIFTTYEAPDEAFMVLALRPDALDEVKGVVEYAPEFDGV